jgi:hypothetical protein
MPPTLRKLLKWLSWAGVAVLYLALAACVTQRPMQTRDWTPYLAHTTQVEIGPEAFAVEPVSNWSFDTNGPTTQDATIAAFRFDELRRVWFVLEPQPGSDAAAHTFLLFEFTDNRLLGLTVEARREAKEEYNAILGGFNAYELSYVWATARDLMTGRAVRLKHELYAYPIEIAPNQLQSLLRTTLTRTKDLAVRPRFYNTLFSNCTNELAKAAGLSWTYQWILTGYSDEYLFKEKIIPKAPGDADFEAAKTAARVEAQVADMNGIEDPNAFDAALLTLLRARIGTAP